MIPPLPPEPPDLEVVITLGLGLSVLSFYYNGYAQSLNLTGHEHVLDFGSVFGACSRHIARNKLDRLEIGANLNRIPWGTRKFKLPISRLSIKQTVSLIYYYLSPPEYGLLEINSIFQFLLHLMFWWNFSTIPFHLELLWF